MHDIYYGTALPPDRTPIPILRPPDRIGVPHLRCPPEKIIAVVPANHPDYPTPSRPAGRDSELIAGYVLDFLAHEARHGRLPAALLPFQSGVGNGTNAVLARPDAGPFAPADRLYRSGPGRHAAAAALRHHDRGLGDGLFPQR